MFWLVSAIVFSVFSLGPILHINGETTFTVFNMTIPLPYTFLYYFVPFLENSRTVGRFFVIASLAFAVLTGYGSSEIAKKHKSSKNAIFSIIFVLIIFEYLCVPFTVSSIETSSFYKEISEDTTTRSLLEIPATYDYEAGIKAEYYQTIHHKPIVGGQVARVPQGARNFELNTPVIRELTYLQPFTADILNQNTKEVGTSILNYYNISYIVLHKNYLSDKKVNLTEVFIQKMLNTERKSYENDSLITYHVKKEPIKSFMVLQDNWYNREMSGKVPTRLMANNATLMIYSDEKVNKTLSFRISSYYTPKKIEVYFKNICYDGNVPTNFVSMKIPLTLEKGENIIRFSTPDKCYSPSQVKSGSKDNKIRSFAIQNITIS